MSSSRNFLLRYAPDCKFSSPKMKKLLTVGGGGDTPLPHPPPARSLRSLAKIAPPNVLAHYATGAPPPPNALTHSTPLVRSDHSKDELQSSLHSSSKFSLLYKPDFNDFPILRWYLIVQRRTSCIEKGVVKSHSGVMEIRYTNKFD